MSLSQRSQTFITCVIISLVSHLGCSDEEGQTPSDMIPNNSGSTLAEGEQRYLIPFVASVNELPLNCGTEYDGVGIARSTIEVRDFRFYLYDVHLINAEGESVSLRLDEGNGFQLRYPKADGTQGGLALIDFTDTASEICADRGTAEINTLISGIAQEGDYQKITFTLGVPSELNHVNSAVSQAPLNTYGMQWT